MSKNITDWIKKNLITRYMMPNGCPDREKCFETLQMVLDGEDNPETRKQFDRQMDSCWQCFKEYNLDSAVKELLQNKVEKKEVPAELTEAIREQIGKVS